MNEPSKGRRKDQTIGSLMADYAVGLLIIVGILLLGTYFHCGFFLRMYPLDGIPPITVISCIINGDK